MGFRQGGTNLEALFLSIQINFAPVAGEYCAQI